MYLDEILESIPRIFRDFLIPEGKEAFQQAAESMAALVGVRIYVSSSQGVVSQTAVFKHC